MKKVILLFIIQLFLFAPRLQAQNFWEQLPFPDTLDISCVAFNQAGDIFVTTGAEYVTNGVFRSTDEGQTWEVLLTNGNFGVGQIAINDSGDIYLSKDGIGQFLASYDNGNTWIQKPYPLIVGASKICFQGVDTILVASGKDDGVILLRTPDRGTTWETIFETNHHVSESISDIAIAPDGTIYISMMCFIANQGGVYKSTDNGSTWQYVGLINKQILDLELNAAGDLYIGVFSGFVGSGGIFVMRHNSSIIDTCLYGPMANGLVVNPAGHIYAGIGWPDGVIVSKDNGLTFEFENSGLPAFPMGQLEIDHQNFIYAQVDMPSPILFRTVDPTYVSINKPLYLVNKDLLHFYPNPAFDNITVEVGGRAISDGCYKLFLFQPDSRSVICKEVAVSGNRFQLTLEQLTYGTYLVRLQSEAEVYFGTLIKI